MRMRFAKGSMWITMARTMRIVAAACAVGSLAVGWTDAAAQNQGATPAAEGSSGAQQDGKVVKTPLYTVQDGNKVDPNTLMGWKTWRAMACERCHGPEQEGLVGPSLVNSLKVLTKEQFHTTIMNGRPEKGMPNFGGVHMIQENWEHLYAYLKGRSEGNIKPGHLYPMDGNQQAAQAEK